MESNLRARLYIVVAVTVDDGVFIGAITLGLPLSNFPKSEKAPPTNTLVLLFSSSLSVSFALFVPRLSIDVPFVSGNSVPFFKFSHNYVSFTRDKRGDGLLTAVSLLLIRITAAFGHFAQCARRQI